MYSLIPLSNLEVLYFFHFSLWISVPLIGGVVMNLFGMILLISCFSDSVLQKDVDISDQQPIKLHPHFCAPVDWLWLFMTWSEPICLFPIYRAMTTNTRVFLGGDNHWMDSGLWREFHDLTKSVWELELQTLSCVHKSIIWALLNRIYIFLMLM